MRYIALGDLVADCYYHKLNEKEELLKIDGGSSRFNVIANLAARGKKTAVISGCGNDILGDIAFDSLNRLNVDTSQVIRNGNQTRAYHLIVEGNKHISLRNCPICGNRTWYEPSIVSSIYCLSKISIQDVLILDGLKPENIQILTTARNEKVLDIGRVKRLKKLSNQEILYAIQNRNIEILQLNESVEQYLIKRFFLKQMTDIYNLFYPKLLIITRGKKGADIITSNKIFHKELFNCQKEIDDTGAGDAFLSMFIQEYYDNSKKITFNWVNSTFLLSNIVTSQVVSKLGARGHLYDGYYSKNIITNCICKKK